MLDKVKCEICGKELKELYGHLKRTHGIYKDEYLKMYPGAKLVSDETQKKRDKALKSPEHIQHLRQLAIDRWTGDKAEEYKKRLSVWMSKRNKENWKNEEYRKKMIPLLIKNNKKLISDPNFIDTVRQSSKKAWSNPKNKEINEKRREQIRQLAKSKIMWNDELRERFSKLMTIKNRKGITGYTVNPIEYKGIVFRSSWELAFVFYLEDRNLEYEYEKYTFTYTLDGKTKRYTPDFYVPKLQTFFEIKGWYKDDRSIVEYKLEQVRKQTGKQCVLVDQDYIDKNNLGMYLNKAKKYYKKQGDAV